MKTFKEFKLKLTRDAADQLSNNSLYYFMLGQTGQYKLITTMTKDVEPEIAQAYYRISRCCGSHMCVLYITFLACFIGDIETRMAREGAIN